MKTTSVPQQHMAANGQPIAGIGHFMVAVGAVIEQAVSGEILVLKRLDEFQKDEWEIIYGRIDQGEDLLKGLQRELLEETGLTEIEIGECLSHWHIFRGEEIQENEVIGMTFVCRTAQTEVQLSTEHSEYQWVSPEIAVELIKVEGIRQDVEKYIAWKQRQTEIAQLQDKAARAMADYQNLVRRTQEERIKLIQLASQDFVTSILDPLEHLHLAASQLKDPGLDMVLKQLWTSLNEQGLVMIDPLGQKFDVHTMEVVEHQGEGQMVVKVVKHGYQLGGQVIQHAKVITGIQN